MSRKVYQVIGFLNTTVQIMNGEHKIRIEFRGGSRHPKLTYGQYVTNDKNIQKALEANSLFNERYKLIKIDSKLTNPIKVEVSPQAKILALTELNANLEMKLSKIEEDGDSPALKAKNKEIEGYKAQVVAQQDIIKDLKKTIEKLSTKAPEEKEEEEVETSVYKDVFNMQKAREVLVKKHGEDAAKLPNGVAVRNKAKDLGVSFPNWK